MGFLPGTFSTPENKSKFLPCDVGIPGPNFFVPKVNKNSGGKKKVKETGKKTIPWSSGIYGTRCHRDIRVIGTLQFFFKTFSGNPLTASASISNSCNICGHLGRSRSRFGGVKLLWLSHWMFLRGLGLPHSPQGLAHDETMRCFQTWEKVGNACFFPSISWDLLGCCLVTMRHDIFP